MPNKVIVELKAVSVLVKANQAHVINYLKATKMKIGLLVHFDSASLKWKRISNLISEDRWG
ncbi:MAG: GxxExxY protein [Treponema sp.]